MVTSSPALMSTWALTLTTPEGEMKNLLLLTQEWERKEKVGRIHLPVLGAMLAALVM